ncbi:uncharacterized protein HMPREF1541_00780 [Cyphellophora europaea CBS 101466]|uniref:FAD-binding domain-containing protein n=1 Tax=Cyphellophora europaea (strain CBS 101466) TaxID=1220924 RepID=W2SFB1_CYPE1|nr:uncharacterized protein HMPREF1541_00780 [Cyphellophora europaea CBS 101466]ETN46594.1 hypothetical protein HMPREF1541_00780 [Cyphellophora europaea CBS 101466]
MNSTSSRPRWKGGSIIVVGAGIGGLAAAVSLAQKTEHSIRVLESSPTLKETGAGIQITPNASRILTSWALKDDFEAVATLSDYMEVRRYATNEAIGLVPSDAEGYATRVWGSPHWTIHRADYQQILAARAASLGVQMSFGAKVVSVDSEACTVQLADDSILAAELIVGADGIRSRVRSSIPRLAEITPLRAENYCYRVLLTRQQMLSHPLVAEVMLNPNRMAWAGHKKHIIGYPIAHGELYNLVIIIPDVHQSAPLNQYNQPGSVEEMLDEIQEWHPAVRTMLRQADSCAKWTLADLPPLPTWHSDSGRIVLLGDAAHATTPHAASGAALALEDAEVLGCCVAACAKVGDLPKVMEVYESQRKKRCERVVEVSRQNANTFSMPDGEAQRVRDAQFAAATERVLAQVRGDQKLVVPEADMEKPFPSPAFLMWLYGYDAIKAAEDSIRELDL